MISGPGKRLPARPLLGIALLLVALLAAVGGARADTASARTVHFAGRAVHVPSGFEVVRVAPHSRTCVRLDRRVVYLGAPSKEQSCPAGPILGKGRPSKAALYQKGPLLLFALDHRIGRAKMDELLGMVGRQEVSTTGQFLADLAKVAGPDAAREFEAELRKP